MKLTCRAVLQKHVFFCIFECGFPTERKGTPSYRDGVRVLAQISWRGYGVSILGDTQKPSGRGPEWPCLSRGLDKMTSGDPFPP